MAHYLRLKYKKEAFVVTGDIDSKNSRSTNILIKEGVKPYLSSNDIVNLSRKHIKVYSFIAYLFCIFFANFIPIYKLENLILNYLHLFVSWKK